MRKKIKLTKEKKLKDGSTVFTFDFSKTTENMFYKLALKRDDITPSEIEYQLKANKTFKEALVSAFLIKTFIEACENHDVT